MSSGVEVPARCCACLLALPRVSQMSLNPSAVVWTEAEGEIVAIDNATSEYLSINDSAAVFWRLIGAGCDEDGLIARLQREYQLIEKDKARTDVHAFVEALRARGFLA